MKKSNFLLITLALILSGCTFGLSNDSSGLPSGPVISLPDTSPITGPISNEPAPSTPDSSRPIDSSNDSHNTGTSNGNDSHNTGTSQGGSQGGSQVSSGVIDGSYMYFMQSDSRADRSFMRTPYLPNEVPSVTDSYYESIRGRKGASLTTGLKSIVAEANTSYDWSRYEKVDEDPFNSSNVFMIYARDSYPKSSHVSGNAAYRWNKEHTYPQSKLNDATMPGAKSDSQLIFADDWKTNGARSNYPYGEVSHSDSTAVKDSAGRVTANWLSGDVFEPCDAAKGEVARATLYTNLRYDKSITGNIKSLDMLLRWNNDFPVTGWEILRNNRNYEVQGNRNPFIDHPEFAEMIFDSSYNGSGALNDSGKAKVTGLTLNTNNVVKNFEVYDNFNRNNLIVTAHYDDGTTAIINSGYMTSLDGVTFTDNHIGTQTVLVSYEGQTASYTIQVAASTRVVSAISIDATRATKSFTVGETFSSSGLVVTVIFSDGQTMPINGFTANFDNHVFTINDVGNQEVRISYMNFTQTYNISVTEMSMESTIEFKSTDFGTYPSKETEINKGGKAFLYNAIMNQNNTIQLKNGLGYIRNKAALALVTIELTFTNNGSVSLYVGSAAITSDAGTVLEGTKKDNTITYDLNGEYTYFRIKNKNSVANLSSIKIVYAMN